MGASSEASAPAEGRRMLFRTTYTHDKSCRMVEWNKDWTSFKDFEAKVRLMFSIREKEKLRFNYYTKEDDLQKISISSDEELATAISLLGDNTVIKLIMERQNRRKSKFCRLAATVKAYQPQATALLITAKSRACIYARQAVACVRSSASAFASKFTCPYARANANVNPNPAENNNGADASANAIPPQPRRGCKFMRRTLPFTLFFLLLAAAIGVNMCHHHKMLKHYPQYMQQFSQHMEHHGGGWRHPSPFSGVDVTIVGAMYGGRDVTQQLQKYYEKNRSVMASNTVFGDPAVGIPKFLHVVYKGSNNMMYSQAFPESENPQPFSMNQPPCGDARPMFVDGQQVQILGVMANNQDLTCAVRTNLQMTQAWNNGQVVPSQGSMFTVIYTKLHHGRGAGRVFALTSYPGHPTSL